jgi:hypothetical protein
MRAADHHEFFFGTNWIRSSIPEYAAEEGHFQELMAKIMRSTESEKSPS